jgi:hypothetical protein
LSQLEFLFIKLTMCESVSEERERVQCLIASSLYSGGAHFKLQPGPTSLNSCFSSQFNHGTAEIVPQIWA